tara:strand:- start:604 stop:1467 length:864 start_codon:yes stop_codon:yes gene_type:complete
MSKINQIIELTRIKKPIGFMLLFWPCAWGLTVAYDFNNSVIDYIKHLLLFLAGAILMRSAGCIVNDIVDRNYDKKVDRTKDRPIASGKISVKLGLFYSSILCLVAFFVLLQFNSLTIFLALASMPLAFIYPYMKRFTYWPQLFLGITFNYGLLLGWTSVENSLSIAPFFLYLGAIFWTLGYDTIYGYQDIKDDEIIGVKSTSIKFKNNPKKFISLCYLIAILSIITTGYLMDFNYYFYLFIILPILHFFFQIKNLNISDGNNCLNIFKSNNFLGFYVFFSFMIGKFI